MRKPGAVLAMLGVEPGMTVFDIFSGGGYYVELLAALAGPSGKVIAHNNEAYLDFVKDELEMRFAGGRLGQVERSLVEANDLAFAPGSLDAALFVLGYHDIYSIAEDGSWPPIDRDLFLGHILSALKPGGVFVVVDHVALEGAPSQTGNSIHRIDIGLVKREIKAAGFVLDGESDALRNPDDDHIASPFDKTMRRRTDRFILRFKKPL